MSLSVKSWLFAFIASLIIIIPAFVEIDHFVSSSDPQYIAVRVVSQNDTPLDNVSVQAVVLGPASLHAGFVTVFSGFTGSTGIFKTTNLTNLTSTAEEWKSLLGTGISSNSPTLTLFLTYSDSLGIYYRESSISGEGKTSLVSDILSGRSCEKTVVLNISGAPNFPLFNNSASPQTQDSNSIQNPSGPYGYVWVEVKCYNTGTVHVPISWVSAQGDAYAGVNSIIYSTSSVKWNLGIDLGIGSSGISLSTGFQAGGTVWQNTNVFIDYWNTGFPSNNGYVYIDAQAAGALFQLYTYNPFMCARFGLDRPHPTDDFQYDAGIINPSVSSSGYILGGAASGLPPDISQIDKNFSENFYGFYIGQGSPSNSPNQKIYSNSFVDDYASSDTKWISVGISVGVLLIWALGPEIAIPSDLLLSVVGSISSSAVDLSLAALSFDAPSGSSIYVYIDVGNVNYQLANGQTGKIPLMGGEVVGIQQGL